MNQQVRAKTPFEPKCDPSRQLPLPKSALDRAQRAVLFWLVSSGSVLAAPALPALPSALEMDPVVAEAMAETGARGMAIAVIHQGKPTWVRSYGVRNAAGSPLQTDTIMYGASLTKTVFAWTVLQWVEEGVLALDRSIAEYLPRPLPEYPSDERYAPWPDLADEPRWRQITPRILLTHSAGFANFAFLEPDGKLRLHFEPGQQYAYSGEGFILMQFVLERGLGFDLGKEMQTRVFDRFNMPNTSMIWRPEFAANLADGWKLDGSTEVHDERSRVRAAGSMDTTIKDIAQFVSALVRGDGLAPKWHAEMLKAQRPIHSATQFPSLQPEPEIAVHAKLAAGLGLIVFEGPQGPGFMKGGHNDSTANMMVCVQAQQRCMVILANDVRAERAFPYLFERVLGEVGMPWRWEYGDMDFWRPKS